MSALVLLLLITRIPPVWAAGDGWYEEGDFAPSVRVKIVLENTLDFYRTECPVTVPRGLFPIVNFGERDITIVDPLLLPHPEPTKEDLLRFGGHLPLGEKNGSYIKYQLDDLDKDGIWDELFFMTDIEAKSTKVIYAYIGFNNRGLYEHETHAGIANYGRHLTPWWESKVMGWKLWYPTDVDLYAKRDPMLVASKEYTENLSGYHVPYEHGSDIMTVAGTFGAGGVCLFEQSAYPDSVSRPRFGPYRTSGVLNERVLYSDPINDTRFSFDVVVNGPLRSMVMVRTMNWRTGAGVYELEQYYTAYSGKSYSTCHVQYSTYLPDNSLTGLGCGIRKIMGEDDCIRRAGMVISIARDEPLLDANNETIDRQRLVLDFFAIALVVPERFRPEYRFVPVFGENHAFFIPATDGLSYEYLIAGAWSEGSVNAAEDAFVNYMETTAREYNDPVVVKALALETK